VAYSASKGGVGAFTKALAKELAPSHVCVNAIAFGVIDTEMNGFLSEEEKEGLVEEIPACRMGSRTEAADMIFEVANAPEYLTGEVITMDGGWV
jgi:3-oxoacyl-[acyl-carrier protein] reductase